MPVLISLVGSLWREILYTTIGLSRIFTPNLVLHLKESCLLIPSITRVKSINRMM